VGEEGKGGGWGEEWRKSTSGAELEDDKEDSATVGKDKADLVTIWVAESGWE
jgi:hypothetical protein